MDRSPYDNRPFPPSHVLTANVVRPYCPLLRDYLVRTGHENVVQQRATEVAAENAATNQSNKDTSSSSSPPLPVVEELSLTSMEDLFERYLNDPRLSTLTRRQHDRYETLLRSKNKKQSRRLQQEWEALHTAVTAEQCLYRHNVRLVWRRALMNYPRKFTAPPQRRRLFTNNNDQQPCFQLIALPPPSPDEPLSDWDRLRATVVLQQEGSKQLRGKLPPIATILETPCDAILLYENISIQDDTHAQRLAQEHDVSIVTTKETLMIFLENPCLVQWNVPLESSSSYHVLLAPQKGRYGSVREHDTVAIKEALFYHCWREDGDKRSHTTDKTDDKNPEETQYTYSIWNIPSQGGQKAINVLVRQPSLVFQDAVPATAPHVHVNYFPSHAEVATATERAQWLLDALLLPTVRHHLVHIAASTGEVLSVDPVGLAHAIMDNDTYGASTRVISLWHNLLRILRAVPTLGQGNFVLKCPSHGGSSGGQRNLNNNRSMAVAVYQTRENDTLVEETCVDVDVTLTCCCLNDEAAIDASFCPWKWEAPRIIDTFPLETKGTGMRT